MNEMIAVLHLRVLHTLIIKSGFFYYILRPYWRDTPKGYGSKYGSIGPKKAN